MNKLSFREIFVLAIIIGAMLCASACSTTSIVPRSVTIQVCDGHTPCSTYTIRVNNVEISTDALSELALKIINGLNGEAQCQQRE